MITLARMVAVGNRLDQPAAKDRGRDAEHHVAVATQPGDRISGRQEVRLRHVAAGCIGSAGDDEQVVHAAVGRAVGLHEARLADRAVGGDEPGHLVGRTVGVDDVVERIDGRARATHEGLQMARRTLVRVEARPQTIALVVGLLSTGDHVGLHEARQAILEEHHLLRGKSRQRRWCLPVGAGLAHPWIFYLSDRGDGPQDAQAKHEPRRCTTPDGVMFTHGFSSLVHVTCQHVADACLRAATGLCRCVAP